MQQSTPFVFDIEEAAAMPETTENSTPAAAESPTTAAEISPTTETLPATDAATQSVRRARRKPAWMGDYKVTGIIVNNNAITHFALFTDCDPITFECVVREEKWRRAMDVEIEAIERNDT